MVFLLDLNNVSACCRWDLSCSRSGFPALFHSAAWAKAICTSYGVSCLSFAEVPDGEDLEWLVPLFRVRTISGRHSLASTAYGPYGGCLTAAEKKTPVEAAEALARFPDSAGLKEGVIWREPMVEVTDDALLSSADRVTMWLELPDSEDALWSRLRAKERNQIRKAEKAGVSVTSGPACVDAFYQLYRRRMHELGTPAHRRSFFAALETMFGPAFECLVAWCDGSPVAGIVDIEFGRWRVNLYGASDFARRSLCANNLIYWESLRRAIGNGRTGFDFGRSVFGSGQYDFKRHWGAQAHRVSQRMLHRTPEGCWTAENLHDPGDLLPRLWRCLPAWGANILSPVLRPFVF